MHSNAPFHADQLFGVTRSSRSFSNSLAVAPHSSKTSINSTNARRFTIGFADALNFRNKEIFQLSVLPQEKQDDDVPCNKSANFAVALDIDGVLVRGKMPIDTAASALKILECKDIPYILLTNGGGLTEAAHAELLGKRLGVHIDEDQFVQSHTPFKTFLEHYKNQWVLCLGGKETKSKELAAAYGFSADKVIGSSDLVKMFPNLHPFAEMTIDHHLEHGVVIEGFRSVPKIAAIFVFSSPRDWCLDLQLCLDLLASAGGRLFTRSALNGNHNLPNHGYQQDGQPPIYFCNPDLEWATSCMQPRIAQGAFRAALEGMWSNFTHGKAPLHFWTCGKPTHTTYDYAEHAIEHYRRKISTAGAVIPDLRTIYMIGDNPASDVAGANAAQKASNKTWKSVLVETGIYKHKTTPEHIPTVVKPDVLEAVEWILREEHNEQQEMIF